MNELLKIDNLEVSFYNPAGEIKAVRDVSITIRPGETLALVGESGSGKTVLCKSMLKVLCSRGKIKAGEITLDGANLTRADEKEMKKYRGKDIAMVFQDPMTALDPAFAVGEQISEVLRLHKGLSRAEAREEAIRLMELVAIDNGRERYRQKPYQFSGGMRQRIAIAMALAAEPKLLLADEPTTALDEETCREVLSLIKSVQKKTGVAILFITHDLALAREMAESVAIMKDGRIVERGTVKEVFANPQHEYTKKLIGYLNYRDGKGHNHIHEGEEERGEDSSSILEVRGLCKSFRKNKKRSELIFEDISFDVKKCEVVGIVGRSGCGKSTLSRCIMGIEPYDRGEIAFAEGIRKQMIFQDSQSAFNDRMRVEQIIAEPLEIKKRKSGLSKDKIRRKVSEAMADTGLDEKLAGRRPDELSGGQRQKVAIARALVTEPGFIIADEPLTGLDVTSQAQILHLLKELTIKKHMSVLFIAHDMHMINHISHKIIRMG